MSKLALLNIQAVARQTGLSTHVIRIWEKRYRAVVPARTPTNRRLYGEPEIERLNLLARATQSGHTISQVAPLTIESLRKLVARATPVPRPAAAEVAVVTGGDFVTAALAAIRELDATALDRVMKNAELALGQMGLLCKVLTPLLEQLGRAWSDGESRPAHEHLASQVVRSLLGNLSRPYAVAEHAPHLIVGTPLGQLHELGALMAAATAHHSGWHVTYLGPSLPAEEFAGAARQKNARAVALSIVHPEDDPRLARELEKLRESLPSETAIIVGGRASKAYAPVLREIGALTCGNLTSLQNSLDRIRQPRHAE